MWRRSPEEELPLSQKCAVGRWEIACERGRTGKPPQSGKSGYKEGGRKEFYLP
jgi:hypothetical protein